MVLGRFNFALSALSAPYMVHAPFKNPDNYPAWRRDNCVSLAHSLFSNSQGTQPYCLPVFILAWHALYRIPKRPKRQMDCRRIRGRFADTYFRQSAFGFVSLYTDHRCRAVPFILSAWDNRHAQKTSQNIVCLYQPQFLCHLFTAACDDWTGRRAMRSLFAFSRTGNPCIGRRISVDLFVF